MTRISVLIVAYNDAKLLKDSLPRIMVVMKESGYQYEIVGVDNGSSDDSMAMLSRYCDRVLRIEQNKFYAPALNKGYDSCSGDLILLTCPDMTWDTSVQRLLDYAVAHEDCLVAPLYYNVDGSPQHMLHNRRLSLSQAFFLMTPLGAFLDHHIAGYAIRRINRYDGVQIQTPFLVDWTGGMFAIPRRTVKEVGGSDERMPLCYHDADFCDKLSELGMMRVVIPNSKVFHIWAGTTSRDPRTSFQPARDFRTYVSKRWRLKRYALWPLLFLASAMSVPLIVITKKRMPSKDLLALRVG